MVDVLKTLNGETIDTQENIVREIITNEIDDESNVVFQNGEHVIGVWEDEKESHLTWFLGVVEAVSGDTVDVVYFHRRYRHGRSWSFPEDGDPIPTPADQIICKNLMVSYMETSIMRCNLNKDTRVDIENGFQAYIKTL